jgi:hypothetical protein
MKVFVCELLMLGRLRNQILSKFPDPNLGTKYIFYVLFVNCGLFNRIVINAKQGNNILILKI